MVGEREGNGERRSIVEQERGGRAIKCERDGGARVREREGDRIWGTRQIVRSWITFSLSEMYRETEW